MTPEQDELVTEHLNLVSDALRSMPWTQFHNDHDGLRGAASLGLVQAAAAYRPSTGVPFRHFALIRIRGAVLDEVRVNQFGGRGVVEEWRAVRDAAGALRNELDREVTAEDLAAHLDWSPERVRRAEMRRDQTRLRSLDVLVDAGLEPRAGDDPTAPHDTADTAAILATCIAQLRPRQQLVIDALFFAGQRQGEVAAAMGVTESRVSQLLNDGLRKLRASVIPALTGKAA